MSLSPLSKYQNLESNFASGCFGQLSLAKDKVSGMEVVIKKIKRETGSLSEDVKREVDAGRLLCHENVSKFVEYFEEDGNDFIVLERVRGIDLFRTMEKRGFVPFSERTTQDLFSQILDGIEYSHSQGVVHRDIKLENILIDSKTGHITVIDYGLCDIVPKGGRSKRFCGSLDYVAPEIVTSKTYDGAKADVFSLGVVLYTLLFAEFPFVTKDRIHALKYNLPQPLPALSESKMRRLNISKDAKDLITKMLRYDPEARLSIEQVWRHPFMKSFVQTDFEPIDPNGSS